MIIFRLHQEQNITQQHREESGRETYREIIMSPRVGIRVGRGEKGFCCLKGVEQRRRWTGEMKMPDRQRGIAKDTQEGAR